MAPGSLGPRREHDRRDFEPRCPHRLDREQGVVDRPETRRGHHHYGQPAVASEVPHQVVGTQRDEKSADALAHEEFAGRTGCRKALS